MKRTFVLGDEWLYFKIYTGHKTSDSILSEIIKPITDELLNEEIIDKWFFIRYTDPKFHLRIRFHYQNPDYISIITKRINKSLQPYIEDFLIWKIQTDTYQRELERYGIRSIEIAELFFFHDSNMVVNMLDMIEGDEGEVVRWLFALRAADELLNDLNYNIEDKYNLMKRLQEGFGREFGMNKQLEIQLGDKFRMERNAINEVLDRRKDQESEMLPLFEILNVRSQQLFSSFQQLLKFHDQNELITSKDDLTGSYIHMMLNRIFRSKQRLHELVIYDFLYRYYKSEIAKRSKALNNSGILQI